MVDPRKEPLLRQVAAESFGQMMSERRTTDLLMMSQSLVVSLEGFCVTCLDLASDASTCYVKIL